MSDHTQEPWEAVPHTKGSDYEGASTILPQGAIVELSVEDAERAVACVNALAGIDDPDAAVEILRDLARAGENVSSLLGTKGEATKEELVNVITAFGAQVRRLLGGE